MSPRRVTAGAVALFAGPLLLDWALHGSSRLFRLFAADSYLYLSVGRNFARLGTFSIDQEHATNGFHPLWQLVVAGTYMLGLPEPGVLVLLFLIQVALIAAALVVLCAAYRRAEGGLPATFLLLPLGLYGALVAGVETSFGPRGSLWGYVNGMESGLLLFLYALLVREMLRGEFPARVGSLVRAGVVLALLFLARLDTAFLVVALCGVLAAEAAVRRSAVELARVAWLAGPAGVALLLYLAWSWTTTGMWLPASGLAKLASPGLDKLGELARLPAQPEPGSLWRLAQILVPMAAGTAGLLVYGRMGRGGLAPIERVWLATSLFAVLLGAYHFLVVPTLDQGHWYFPISTLFVSLLGFHAAARTPRLAFLGSRAAASAYIVLVLGVFGGCYYPSSSIGAARFRDFVREEAPEAMRRYGSEPPRVLSFDDGILAWATGWPVMTGRGFMLDAEAIQVFRDPDRSLLELAEQRGFDRIGAVFYFDASHLSRTSSSEQIARELERQLGIPRAELSAFRWSIDHLSESGRFALLRMQKRS